MDRITRLLGAAILLAPTLAIAAAVTLPPPQPYVKLQHPAWTRSASLYQINTRQFSKAGTFAAVQAQLPRLKALGVDILWLMPIHPIGEEKRKGSLGSPYAVKDYYAVNPEFGTLDDLKALVDAAHAQGMYVILDWVANHTAWDNPIREQHPEWYDRDYKGDYRPTPWWDWSDIIDLDYRQAGVREYMADAMSYWVREVGIDGYRCDVAGFVPLDFWKQVRARLDAIKPVFMLAEWESRDLHAEAFDATYAWSWHEAVHDVIQGHAGLDALFVYYSWRESAYPADAYRMTYIANHDSNAWEGTQFEKFGDGLEAAIVLSVVGDGMPLIYNGQEAGNPRRLAFFEKDPITWREHPIGDLYETLFDLKERNTTLHNGAHGATMLRVWNTAPEAVFSFVRQNAEDKVFVAINFSDEPQSVTFSDAPFEGRYLEIFTGEDEVIDADFRMTLPPWGYRVYTGIADR
ncbi:MAG: alpha-amylase family glycosyl hydrolase [Pseudomonadota bacterium]